MTALPAVTVMIPGPGSPFGPCANDCSHLSCLDTRLLAAEKCIACAKPIGYWSDFYKQPVVDGHKVERVCVMHRVCPETPSPTS